MGLPLFFMFLSLIYCDVFYRRPVAMCFITDLLQYIVVSLIVSFF